MFEPLLTKEKSNLEKFEEVRFNLSVATIIVLIIVAILRTDSNSTSILPRSRVHVTFLIPIAVARRPLIRLELSKMSTTGQPIRDEILSQAKSWSTTCFKQSAVFIVSIVLSFIALLILHLAFGISLAFRAVFYIISTYFSISPVYMGPKI